MSTDSRRENKKLYKTPNEVLRKWISIYRKVAKYGERSVNERILSEAFNLTELLMDNYIDDFSTANWSQAKRVEERPKIFEYPDLDITIDYGLRTSFKGKTMILEKIGLSLPSDLNEVREVRNFYTHSTNTFKEREAKELDDYHTFQRYVLALGRTVGKVSGLTDKELFPEYTKLKLQEGMEFGKNDEYLALERCGSNDNERIFIGKSSRINEEVYIVEIVPKNLTDSNIIRYKALFKIRKNGLARLIDLVYENKTIYLIFEKISGVSLQRYLAMADISIEKRQQLYCQIESLIASVVKQGIYASFNPKNLVLDEEGLLWLQQYGTEFKELNIGQTRKYCLTVLDLNEMPQSNEVVKESKPIGENNMFNSEERTEIVVNTPKTAEHTEIVVNAPKSLEHMEIVVNTPKSKRQEMMSEEPQVAPNNYNRLWAVLSGSVGILVVLWIISAIIG